MKTTAKPVANPAVIYREIFDGEAVLVNMDTAASLALTNHTATLVWQLVDGERTIERIVVAIRQYFENTPDTVTDDVIALLDILAEDGFIGFE